MGSAQTPNFTLSVDVAQDQWTLVFTIHFDNTGSAASTEVVLTDTMPAGSTLLGAAADPISGVWTLRLTDVAPGPHTATVSVRLPDTVADGDRVTNVVTLRYLDAGNTWISKAYATVLTVEMGVPITVPGPATPAPNPSWIFAGPALVAVAALAVLARRSHRPKLEQVFLLHNSGMLIHHWAANAPPSRDIDILGGMLVILREFVRDSFQEKQGGLSELQFGDSRVFLAEGRYAVLAAVVRGPHANGVPGEVASAVEDFERIHGPALAGWTGHLDQLPGAKAVVDGLVRGHYRNWHLA